ncbi:hypothetical protein SDC9_108941 [bioreactor metagenome]|uniref:Uncharacterized protein n=1 Tax=bioreactor metagenome TaxID=1076179 RepID=A0A645B9H3_9ZZZZ
MTAGIGAGGELALDGGPGQHDGVGDQGVDGVDGGVEVVLDGVEVAVVVVGDARRDGALGDAVDIVGGDVERADDGIEGGIDAFDDLAIVALVTAGVGAGGQLALDRGLRQQGGVTNHGVDIVLDRRQCAFDFPQFIAGLDRDGLVELARRDALCRLCRAMQAAQQLGDLNAEQHCNHQHQQGQSCREGKIALCHLLHVEGVIGQLGGNPVFQHFHLVDLGGDGGEPLRRIHAKVAFQHPVQRDLAHGRSLLALGAGKDGIEARIPFAACHRPEAGQIGILRRNNGDDAAVQRHIRSLIGCEQTID